MIKKLTYIVLIISLLILFLSKVFLFEKSIFWRDFSENKILKNIFPYQYDKKYFQELWRQNPTIFSTSIWESYMRACHQQKKLCSFFPYQQIAWDILRMRNIQYVWNDIFAAYTSWLYESLDNLTSILPYRQYPYVFGQYILPMQKNLETWNKEIKELSWQQTTDLWEKWIKYLCDQDKINKCESYVLPHNLWFNYYFLKDDLNNAIKYYKIASLSYDAPQITSQMPAIIAWRLWDHIKSMSLRYGRYLEASDTLKYAKTTKEQEKINTYVERYLRKALMEYTIQIIIDAEKWQTECVHDLSCMQTKWYIQYTIKEKLQSCNTNSNKTITESISCQILAYWLDQKYIKSDWTLIYPLESWFIYWRRPDYKQRRIIPQMITD